MLFIALLLVLPRILDSLGLSESRRALLLAANLSELGALLMFPLSILAWIFGPALIALRKRRTFLGWLAAGFFLGVPAFVVAFLPPGPSEEQTRGELSRPCPSCSTPYFESDYSPDLETWRCSSCGHKLPKAAA